MADARPFVQRHGFAAVALWLGVLVLLPFGRSAEVPVLLGALAGTWCVARGTIQRDGTATRLALLLFAGYWLPELASAFDSLAPRKSWIEVVADLRFLPFLLYVAHGLAAPRRLQQAAAGTAVLLVVWCIDALSQAATGISLGGAAQGDRLSGIFGDDNLKLGGVVATLSPFALLVAWRRFGVRGALPAFALVLAVVLLAGARAAWVSFGLVAALVAWRRLGLRRGSVALAALLAIALSGGALAFALSANFAARVERTAQVFRGGDVADLDHALAYRLPIWRAATSMAVSHPLNGVGVRAFRVAYPLHAGAGDRWLDPAHGTGALHAHQLLLEIASETGVIGLGCWLALALLAWRAWRRASPAARERGAAPAYALAAMLFPLNTHYAVYSSFQSLLLVALAGLWLAALASEDGA